MPKFVSTISTIIFQLKEDEMIQSCLSTFSELNQRYWYLYKIQIAWTNLSVLCKIIAKVLGHPKHVTAEELHKLVLLRKITYEEIRRIDPVKFVDLETTMRMLYDHGDMQFDDS